MNNVFGPVLFIIRFILFFILSFIIASYAMLCWLLPKWKSVKALAVASKIWAYGAARIFGLKIKISGNRKSVHGLVVSNHLSYVDILLLGSIFPLRFAPKSDVAKWPILGWILGSSRPIWVDRSSKYASLNTMKEFSETVKNDINLIAFPEGTTSDGKSDLFPFKSTTFEAAMQGNVPICPVLIVYEQDNISWAIDNHTPLLIHAWRVLQLFQIRAELHILKPVVPPEGGRRKEFCRDVYNIMNERYREIISLKNKSQAGS
jgi:1-acyl-sn-glycerol-3-phosphate acyltransferase